MFSWYALYQVHYSPFESTRAFGHLCSLAENVQLVIGFVLFCSMKYST